MSKINDLNLKIRIDIFANGLRNTLINEINLIYIKQPLKILFLRCLRNIYGN